MTQPAYKPFIVKSARTTRSARKALVLFGKHLTAAGRTAPTRAVYTRIVARWLEDVPDWRAPDGSWLRRYFWARRRAVAASTVNLELAAVRSFYKFARDFHLVQVDVAARLPRSSRPPEKLPVAMSAGQVEQLLTLPDSSTLIGLRDLTMMTLIWETGIRAGELVSLTLGDVLHEEGFLYIDATRSACERVVPYSRALGELLDDWIRRRVETRPGKSNTLFVTRRGKSFRGARSVWEIVNRYLGQAVHLGGNYQLLTRSAHCTPWSAPASPQAMRGAFAATLVQNGCDVRSLQELLGHRNIHTTVRFEKLDITTLKREHGKLFSRRQSE